MSKYKAILTGLLGTAYKMPAEEIAELLDKSDDQLDEKEVLGALKQKDKERISALGTERFNDGHKKAEGKIRTQVEADIKKTFGIESDKVGEELLTEIFEATKAKQPGGKTKELSDDDVKRHPVYIQLETNSRKLLEDTTKEFQDKLKTIETEQTKKEARAAFREKLSKQFDELKPILSSDPEKAKNQKADFLAKFDEYDFEEVEGKIIISKGGRIEEDEHGHKKSLDVFVKSTAEKYFDFTKAEERSSTGGGSGNEGGSGKDKKPYTGVAPKNKEEYNTMISDSSKPLEDRLAIRENFSQQFS